MAQWFYLILDVLTILFPLLWTWDKRIGFRRWLRPIFLGILVANMIYWPWDVWFTADGVWGFNDDFHLPFTLFHLPLEEWLWFIVTPYACFFILASVHYFKHRLPVFPHRWIHIGLGVLIGMIAIWADGIYTQMAFGVASVSMLISAFRHVNWSWFWLMYAITLIPFFIFNSALTGAFTADPVVWYNHAENLGIRMGTIPLEDSLYLLAYLQIIFLFVGNLVTETPDKRSTGSITV